MFKHISLQVDLKRMVRIHCDNECHNSPSSKTCSIQLFFTSLLHMLITSYGSSHLKSQKKKKKKKKIKKNKKKKPNVERR
jgi:hypothetical protein